MKISKTRKYFVVSISVILIGLLIVAKSQNSLPRFEFNGEGVYSINNFQDLGTNTYRGQNVKIIGFDITFFETPSICSPNNVTVKYGVFDDKGSEIVYNQAGLGLQDVREGKKYTTKISSDSFYNAATVRIWLECSVMGY